MWRQMHLFKLYWSIAKTEKMCGPLLFKAGSNILVVIYTQQTVLTTSHVASTSVQCGIFQVNLSQLNPPNDEKSGWGIRECLWVPKRKRWRTANDKMGEYLCSSKSRAYGNHYLKENLLSWYGDSIFVTKGRSGVKNIVTFRKKKTVTFFVNTTIHCGRTKRKQRNEQFSKPQLNSSTLISRMLQS